jgi:hypothetical protein
VRGESGNRSLFGGEPIQQRGGVLQTTGFINQLFDIHRNGYAFSDAAGQRAGLGGFCDTRGFVQLGVNSVSIILIAGSIVARSMMASR